MWTQRTGSAPPGTRPTDVEETNPYSGWPQRAISLRDIMNHECFFKHENVVRMLSRHSKPKIDATGDVKLDSVHEIMYGMTLLWVTVVVCHFGIVKLLV